MGRAGSQPRVLYVDDDPQHATMVADQLTAESDIDVATETAAADALERLGGESFECLLSGSHGPDVDGLELVRRVRENHPDLPVIQLTGRASEQVVSEAISAGVTDCFRADVGDDQFALLANRIRTAVECYRAEQALREERRRNDEFVRLVAHDLRNPMTVANGWLEVLENGTDPEVARRKAVDALERMASIVDNLETLARSGDAKTEDECVELSAVATAAWELVDPETADLRVEYGPRVAADPSMLQQALENLFENAVEHGSTSPRQADDAVEHGSTSPPRVEDGDDHGDDVTVVVGPTENGFYVEDDGVGIDPADREKIFRSGYTADGGTGLGLAIVERIADAHEWTLSVTESDAGGARFEFHEADVETAETHVSDATREWPVDHRTR
jgi:signal transduction histidine kinase